MILLLQISKHQYDSIHHLYIESFLIKFEQ